VCLFSFSVIVPHCASSRQIITHWKNCTRNDCPVCLPLKNAGDRRASGPTLGGIPSQPATSVTVSPTASNQVANTFLPNLPPQADMARAYAALGLTPPTQQQQQNIVLARRPGSLASAAANRPPGVQQWPSGTGGQQTTFFADGNSGPHMVQLVSQQQNVAAPVTGASAQQPNASYSSVGVATGASTIPTGLVTDAAQPRPPAKDWHQSVTQDLRNHLVHKL
jgi:E1A/CREB-binding protein